MHNPDVDQMSRNGNSGSRMQTPQDETYIAPENRCDYRSFFDLK